MSIKLMDKVWELQSLSQPRKMLLLSIADYASDEGVAWPAVKTLMRKCSLKSESGTRRAINELVEMGWLSKEERPRKVRKGKHQQDTNLYQINLGKLYEEAAIYEPAPRTPSKPKNDEPAHGDGSPRDGSCHDGLQGNENSNYEPAPRTPDPSVNSKQDPSVIKPVGQLAPPADPQSDDSLKIDYQAVLEAFHTTLPEMPKVLKLTDGRRKVLRKLWKDYDLNIEKWGAYLRYISKKCRWMLEDRPDTSTGRTWRKKDFDYLITEGCYLKVKEERANDLPKVQRLDTAARDDAYLRIVTQRRKPRNEVEQIAQKLAGSLGRMTDYDARRAWVGIWAQAVAQASENDLGRLAS